MQRIVPQRRMLFVLVLSTAFLLVCVQPALAQPKAKLRPLRIALPSNTIAATHFYVGRSLGIFESHGFDPQILVLEPRRIGGSADRRFGFLHCHRYHDARGAAGCAGACDYGWLESTGSCSGRVQGNYQRRSTARQSVGRLHRAGDGEHNSYRTVTQAGTQTG